MRRIFAPRDYVDERGKAQRSITMTKDGFTMLAMVGGRRRTLADAPSALAMRSFDRLQLPHRRLQFGHHAGDLPPHRFRLAGVLGDAGLSFRRHRSKTLKLRLPAANRLRLLRAPGSGPAPRMGSIGIGHDDEPIGCLDETRARFVSASCTAVLACA